ncbi:MAG: YceH family protein [Ignavibacteria bacterium]
MTIELTPHETRVIGCLLEKEVATPEQYPLSLNALTNACNQKSNRDPVLELDEATVQQVVDGLIKKHQVTEHGSFGSRVPKYQHRFCNTNYGALKFSPRELAVVCELFLRGPQTPGELRSRASRLCPFGDVTEVEAVLTALATREDGPFVVRLPREPGKRESRYAHLFGGEVAVEAETEEAPAAGPGRMERMEQRIAALEAQVAELKQLLEGR